MGVARGTVGVPRALLPAVVREGLVGLRHAVRVLALAHRGAAVLGGVHQLVCQTERHGLLARSEEHTSELQSHLNLVCRLLLEKKKTTYQRRSKQIYEKLKD